MPTLFELVKKSGYDVLKTAMMREITYPATASITDATITAVDFNDLTRLDEDGKYMIYACGCISPRDARARHSPRY